MYSGEKIKTLEISIDNEIGIKSSKGLFPFETSFWLLEDKKERRKLELLFCVNLPKFR